MENDPNNEGKTGLPRVDPGQNNDYSQSFPELHQEVRRIDSFNVLPSDGETLRGYASRMHATIALLSQLHINVQGGYYSHTNPRGCFNCLALLGWLKMVGYVEDIADQVERIGVKV